MPAMQPTKLQLAEFTRVVWSVTVPAGATIDEVSSPGFWVHVQRDLKVGARIEVSPESGEWLVEFIVRATPSTGPVLAILNKHVFNAPNDKVSNPDYEVKYAGGTAKWRVVRKSDKHVLVEGLATRDAAEAWLAANTHTDLV